MNIRVSYVMMVLLCTAAASAQKGSPGAYHDGQQQIAVAYGDRPVAVSVISKRYYSLTGRGETVYECKSIPGLTLTLLSDSVRVSDHIALRHQIEISSVRKLTQDLTVWFSLKSLEEFDSLTIPLKNGIVFHSALKATRQIASYRCAGNPEKYPLDVALPLIICKSGDETRGVLTDPYFTSLFDKGGIRWTYPKEVGLEDSVERRTVVEIDSITNMEEALGFYYRTILGDVPPGPDWIKDVAMIGYDYMSDHGEGWYRDIDTLVSLIPWADRHKVVLCLHGWYDVVGRYCYNEKTGRLDEGWTNRIRNIPLTLSDLHRRIQYAKERGFRVLMYFADGVLSSKGLPDFDDDDVLEEGGWNGPDVAGGPYHRNLASARVVDFYRKYARALFQEFALESDGFVWDETFYVKAGNLGNQKHRGYLDRMQMRLVKEIAAILHASAPEKAFFTSDCIGDESYMGESFNDVPPYALVADGCYQDSHNKPSFWSYGIFPNYRNVIWSCNWTALTNFRYTVFGVYAYNTPVVFTNGWGDDRGFSEMSTKERSDLVALFNYRKQIRTRLRGLSALPPYFECSSPNTR